MDEGLSNAVREVFVRLYNEGLGDYIVNWCPRCLTALADDEVEHDPPHGKLYHIRYPYADGSGSVVIATTRPETMLGDTAVAVHPEDERYAGLDKIGIRHNLERVKVMDERGIMNENAGKYAGLDRFACRTQIVKDLEEQGFLVKIEDYEHAVGKCYRCATVIEPITSSSFGSG